MEEEAADAGDLDEGLLPPGEGDSYRHGEGGNDSEPQQHPVDGAAVPCALLGVPVGEVPGQGETDAEQDREDGLDRDQVEGEDLEG